VLVIAVKYITFVMRADSCGEGVTTRSLGAGLPMAMVSLGFMEESTHPRSL